MSALYIGELKSILSQFDESWNEGFSRKHWSIVNGAYDCAYELHYYDDKYNDQFLLTCIMDSMEGMFGEAHSFNQPLDNWNVSNVTSMWAMFSNAHSFNQPLDNWNTNNVDDMTFMFSDAKSFKSKIPDFRNYKGTKEELFDELGLPPDFKPKIKKEQEQEKVHKKSRV